MHAASLHPTFKEPLAVCLVGEVSFRRTQAAARVHLHLQYMTIIKTSTSTTIQQTLHSFVVKLKNYLNQSNFTHWLVSLVEWYL